MPTILGIPWHNPPNRFSSPIEAVVASPDYAALVGNTAIDLISSIASCHDSEEALYELWDAFFKAVVSCPSSHEPHLALLDAIRAQPPTQPKNQKVCRYTQADGKIHWPKLPRFGREWHEVYNTLHAWRDWNGPRYSKRRDGSNISELSNCRSGDEIWLHCINFSAMMLKRDEEASPVYAVWVFIACKDALEPETPPTRQPIEHRMSSEQVWALDVRVAATWVRDGAWALWKTGYDDLRECWAAALDEPTDRWPREDGLNRERWQLWEERLLALSTDGARLDEETRGLVREAFEVVEFLLSEAE